ncbi:DUF1376 domain-containing protein [Acinetobacter tianfuensis]|uniref:DUF1376 domain-containing protein n=1 Tax=Acinetobacter tianfuensis TaxID=2419603 RepID=UPI001BC86F84|nr:DUF1376 domain-containing protein [Acinetobacter tianfuensis]
MSNQEVDIWMPFYIADYLADTTRLNTEQHGAYMLLIMDYWRNGAPPDDDSVLANITKLTPSVWRKHRAALSKLFNIVEGEWVHKRIEREINNATENKSKKSVAGRKGAANKWGNESGEENKLKRSERLAAARAKASHTQQEWLSLVHVCGNQCMKCGATDNLVKDHITPIYQGGSDGVENLQPLCRSCNASKGADTSDLRPQNWLANLQGMIGDSLPERLAKRLANDYQTPNPSSSPSSINNISITHEQNLHDENSKGDDRFLFDLDTVNTRIKLRGLKEITQEDLSRLQQDLQDEYGHRNQMVKNQVLGKLVQWVERRQQTPLTPPEKPNVKTKQSTTRSTGLNVNDAWKDQPMNDQPFYGTVELPEGME